tara:strand:+ start:1077 stop:1628 length:552 start_codon:yes stop_codon:yes gene_type:complete
MKDYLEAIVHIPKILNPDFINKLTVFIDKKAKSNLYIGKNNIDKNIRNVNGYSLNPDTPTNIFYWNFIKNEIERLLVFYKGKFPLMSSDKVDQIDLLKYSAGGKYNAHLDDTTYSPRLLSVILNLNDEYVGGDLIFVDQHYKEVKSFKLTKGSVIFFPSNFMYPHSIKPIEKGKRYSIVSWLR